MSTVVLKAEKRDILGSASAKKIRKSGFIPAIIYSKDSNINLAINGRDFEREYFKGNAFSTVMELELDDKKIKVIAHQIDLDPVSDRPTHIDFFSCDENKSIRAKPKLSFINREKSPGIKRGGFFHVAVRRVEVVCDNEDLTPEKIEVDIGSLHLGSKLRADDLNLPKGTKLTRKGNFLIGSIIGRGKSEDEKSSESTEEQGNAADASAPEAAEKSAKPEEKK